MVMEREVQEEKRYQSGGAQLRIRIMRERVEYHLVWLELGLWDDVIQRQFPTTCRGAVPSFCSIARGGSGEKGQLTCCLDL